MSIVHSVMRLTRRRRLERASIWGLLVFAILFLVGWLFQLLPNHGISYIVSKQRRVTFYITPVGLGVGIYDSPTGPPPSPEPMRSSRTVDVAGSRLVFSYHHIEWTTSTGRLLVTRGWVAFYYPWVLAASILPSIRAWNWAVKRLKSVVKRHRLVPGEHCPSCGYDLRATDNCCPECGQKFERRVLVVPIN